MPRYTVNHRYAAGPVHDRVGPWEPGQEMDLSEEEAARVNLDSPGTLALVEGKPSKPAAEEKPEQPAQRQAKPPRNRQHKGGADRSGT